MGHASWAHQYRRRQNRKDFGGRWQDRIPIRFPDPRPGETLRHYAKRIGYFRDDLAKLCRKSGGDRIWRDEEDLRAWFAEIGYTSPWWPIFMPPSFNHPRCRCVIIGVDLGREA